MSVKILDEYKAGLLSPEAAVEKANKAPISPVRTSGAVRTFIPSPAIDRIGQYMSEKQIRQEMLKRKTPFISKDISDDFYLSQGLILVGGISGRGKSTLAANLIQGYLNAHDTRSALVITNEESTEAVLNRTACVQLGMNFFDFQKGRMSSSAINKIETAAVKLTDRLVVVDDPAWDMTVLEDVQSVLAYAATSDAGIVVLDYLQTVAVSREHPHLDAWQVSKKLGLWLKDYGRKVGMPIVVFAQLKTDSEHSEFKDRVEGDRTVYNHSFQSIEIVPDFENKTTRFKVAKDRFGYKQGLVMEAKFEDGIYKPIL